MSHSIITTRIYLTRITSFELFTLSTPSPLGMTVPILSMSVMPRDPQSPSQSQGSKKRVREETEEDLEAWPTKKQKLDD